MRSISCFIIDDAPSVDLMKKYVSMTARLKLSGHAFNLSNAMNTFLLQDIPDVLFINIDDVNDLDLNFYEYIQKHRISIIVTSTRTEHAFRAFESGSLDYLLKPFSYERFFKSVGRVIGTFRVSKPKDWLYIQTGVNGDIVRVPYEEIYYIEAKANHIIISLYEEKYNVNKSMKTIEEELPPHTFIRVHRSFIVNEAKVLMVNNDSIMLNNKKIVKIGRNYKKELIERLLNIVVLLTVIRFWLYEGLMYLM